MNSTEFTFVQTQDGSPTVRLGLGDDVSEAMHSLKGAFSETAYIYGSAIQTALDQNMSPTVLSLGLGLGYVELLASALFLKKSQELSDHETRARFLSETGGESFELVPVLREWFSSWVLSSENAPSENLPAEFARAYDDILHRTAEYAKLDQSEIKSHFKTMLLSQRWVISEALSSETEISRAFGCICFDAFSSKTSPDLWTEPFLLSFFKKACAPECVLSTYACTGALKRSLRASGFDLNIREGFASKRDSTFAIRSV